MMFDNIGTAGVRVHTLGRSVLVAAMLLGALGACGESTARSPEELIASAQAHQRAGELDDAVIDLKNALQQAPKSAEARWLLGNIYLELGDGAAAEKELLRAVNLGVSPSEAIVPLTRVALKLNKLDEVWDAVVAETVRGADASSDLPDEVRAELFALRGHAVLELGRIDAAERLYESALELSPGTPEARLGMARLDGVARDLDAMAARLEALTASEPEFAAGWSLSADLRRHLGDVKSAEALYTSAIAARADNVRDQLYRALVRLQLGDLDGAEKDIEAVEKRVQAHAGAALARGLLHSSRQQDEAALAAFEKALKYSPNQALAHLYIGTIHLRAERLQQAEDHLARHLARAPESADGARLLALARIGLGDFDGADRVLRPLLAREPNDAETLELLARAAVPTGRLDEGVEYLRRVAVERPESGNAYLQLGLGLLAMGRETEAAEVLATAGELEPDNKQVEYTLVYTYLREGRYDEAIAEAEKLREKSPQSADPLTFIGLAHMRKGELAEARAALERALELSPGDVSATMNLALIAQREGRPEVAREAYEAALELHPTALTLLLSLAQLEAQAGEIDKALELLRTARAAHPTALQPRILLARYYSRSGRPQQALDTLEDIQGLYPDNSTMLIEVGHAQLGAGRPAQAINTFEKLARIAPASADVQYFLAQAHAAAGDEREAARALDEALALDPGHGRALIARARLGIAGGQFDVAAQQLQALKHSHPQMRTQIETEQARLALADGRPQDAVPIYERLLDWSPSSELAIGLASAQARTGDLEAAVATLERWTAANPDDFKAYQPLGELYGARGDVQAAQQAYERVVATAPDGRKAVALNNMAWLLRDSEPARALELVRRALEFAPDDPDVLDTAGVLELRHGDATQALGLLRRASGARPDDPAKGFHLGQALARNGKQAQAREVVERALSTDRPFPEREQARVFLDNL